MHRFQMQLIINHARTHGYIVAKTSIRKSIQDEVLIQKGRVQRQRENAQRRKSLSKMYLSYHVFQSYLYCLAEHFSPRSRFSPEHAKHFLRCEGRPRLGVSVVQIRNAEQFHNLCLCFRKFCIRHGAVTLRSIGLEGVLTRGTKSLELL